MDIKDLAIKGLRRPHRILPFLYRALRAFYYSRKEGRVPFAFYDVVARTIPKFSFELYREVKLLQEALGDYHASCSCAVGCGFGRFTPWMLEYSEEHYSVEPELKLLWKAEEFYPEAHFYRAPAQNFPFPDGKFDLIITWTVLQHIPPKQFPPAVEEIKRVSNPKGIIIISESTEGKPDFWLWFHSIKEYQDSFKPWRLAWSKSLNIGEVIRTAMRFEPEK